MLGVTSKTVFLIFFVTVGDCAGTDIDKADDDDFVGALIAFNSSDKRLRTDVSAVSKARVERVEACLNTRGFSSKGILLLQMKN